MPGRSRSQRSRKSADSWIPGKIVYPKALPISKRRDDIIASIQAHSVIILSGETGSGKTTQIPKMCLDAGRGRKKRIACTQPRRVAALSIARRVAEELGVAYGREVGSKIRFSDKTGPQTRIKFLTDGMLLSEIQADPGMGEYDTVIIDEAHERSLNIDFLLGHLNQLRKRRPDLKIIITSATIDIEKFSKAFDGAPIIEVSGRVYPVEVIHAPLDEILEGSDDLSIINGVAESVDRIASELGAGDILAFLPTERDILDTRDLLEGRFGTRFAILPCFGRLSSGDQQRIFASSSRRKVILATNIAETSLTIPGIRFVIDTGLARTSRYNPRARTKRLPIERVSQSSANQRKGRCGRVEDGICIRLYSQSDFEDRGEYTTPEIQRANLAEVILRMEASKLGEIETFPFIDPPSPAAIKSGYALLEELGAMNARKKLTPIGRKLARLPIDPTAGRMLLQAESEGVVEQVLVIASALAIQDPRERPMGKEEAANAAHKRFAHRDSDFLSLLNIWESPDDPLESLSQSRLRKLCKQGFLSYLRMREWIDVKTQLSRSLADFERSRRIKREAPKYKGAKEKSDLRKFGGIEYRSIHKCLATGLLANPGKKEEPNIYRCTGNRKAMVFPGSGLFDRKAMRAKNKSQKREAESKNPGPNWILAGEIVETSRLYSRTVAAIDPAWLVEVGGNNLKRSYSQPHFDESQGRVVCLESIRIHGLELQRKTISYSKVDPDEATEIFIREGLLNDDFDASYPFLQANRKLKTRIQNAQTTMRMQSWIGIEEAAFRFYASRLTNVASTADLNRWLKSGDDQARDSLLMTEADLSPDSGDSLRLSDFPESTPWRNSVLPIDYQYKPGEADDGVTLAVPYEEALSLDEPMLDWLVPGHLHAKVLHLIKALPKEHRRKLQPVSETAREIAANLERGNASLIDSLSKYLKQEYEIETYESDWKKDAIPSHLSVRIQVRNSKGDTVIEGRSAESIRRAVEEREKQTCHSADGEMVGLWKAANAKWRKRIREVEDLEKTPEKVEIGKHNGIPVYGFPALEVRDGKLERRLMDNLVEARDKTRAGIAFLVEIELRRELAWIQEDLRDMSKLGPAAVAFAPIDSLRDHAFEHLKRSLCQKSIEELDPAFIREAIEESKTASRGLAYKLIDQVQAIIDLRQRLAADKQFPEDLRRELERIVPTDFLLQTPAWALSRMPLYLKALTIRRKAREKDPARDESRGREIDSFRQRLARLQAPEEAKQEIAWSIEEYALSLFAQNLGTAFPISAKRIEARFRDAAGRPGAEATAVPAKPPSDQPPPDKPTDSDLESLKSFFS